MRKDHEEIPQIKPDSILTPPQIKLSNEENLPVEEAHMGAVEPEAFVPNHEESASKKHKFNFKKLKISMPKFKFKFKPKNKKVVYGLFGGLAVVIVLLLIFLVFPLISLYKSGKDLKAAADNLKASADTQDISVVKAEFQNFRGKFDVFKKDYGRLKWVSFVPFVGAYYRDGEAGLNAGTHGMEAGNIVIETIEPYADIIGFGGPNSPEGGDTANDRIEFLIQTIDDILPRIDEISEKARLANEELGKIDPNRYPEEVNGQEVRSKLKQYLTLAEEATKFVAESKPLLEAAPYLLGIDETRTYLLLFQNDKELRPTGGFITAYSIVDVTNGKIQPVSSSDIYHLDERYRPHIKTPKPIVDYIRGPYHLSDGWRLRDMNWNPDFRETMELFLPEAETAGIKDIDGVIAVDTHVVVNILRATGPIDVPGYGLFSSEHDERCDCPQVVYELESFADVEGPIVWSENEPGKIVFAPENYLNRKEIVGPLMNSVLANSLGQPKEKLPTLFEAGWKSITEKHVLLYMFDQKAQEGLEAFGIAGRVEDFNGDYLHIVDANLAGRKSNLYVTQEVAQDIEVAGDGTVTKTVAITYQNPQDYDGWLNSVLPNWTRIYIPKGSEVLETDGFDESAELYEELGKTVISGGFELRPKGIKKITVKYKLPFKASNEYKMLIQKQAGTDSPLHTINIGRKTEEFFLRTDRELKFDI